MDTNPQFRFFDPLADLEVVERDLPHWMQDKTVVFITWRTWDSMPRAIVDRWARDRELWLIRHKISITESNNLDRLCQLSMGDRQEYYRLFSARWERYLDDCLGSCPLRAPAARKIVKDAFHHFDGEKYLLTDYVIMPNHVHILVSFDDATKMLAQCRSWKHYTAVHINKLLGKNGRFWETEAFDHLVRTEEQWQFLRQYIKNNPWNANLSETEYCHYSRSM